MFAGIRRQIVERFNMWLPIQRRPRHVRLMFGVVLGTAIQYLLEPEDPAILDSLDMLVRFFR